MKEIAKEIFESTEPSEEEKMTEKNENFRYDKFES